MMLRAASVHFQLTLMIEKARVPKYYLFLM